MHFGSWSKTREFLNPNCVSHASILELFLNNFFFFEKKTNFLYISFDFTFLTGLIELILLFESLVESLSFSLCVSLSFQWPTFLSTTPECIFNSLNSLLFVPVYLKFSFEHSSNRHFLMEKKLIRE